MWQRIARFRISRFGATGFHIAGFRTFLAGTSACGMNGMCGVWISGAAIPPNELSWGNVGDLWQHIAKCDNMWQAMAKCGNACALKNNMLQHVRNLRPFCENPACPDPVWKPVRLEQAKREITLCCPRRQVIPSPVRMYIYIYIYTSYTYICIYIYIYIYTHVGLGEKRRPALADGVHPDGGRTAGLD